MIEDEHNSYDLKLSDDLDHMFSKSCANVKTNKFYLRENEPLSEPILELRRLEFLNSDSNYKVKEYQTIPKP